jgi:prephenate dehydrogenase
MRVAVLGVGLIGGSIGLAAHEHVEDAEVVGFGRDPGRLRRAVELGAIDRAADSVADAVDGADLCFACAPVGALPELVRAALDAAGPDCVVSDVGSTKQGLLAAIDDERFVGGHPIAGAETAGVEHARADMFQGAVWYLTPLPHSGGLLYERLHRFVVDVGARPVAVDQPRTTGSWPCSATCRTCSPTCSPPRPRRGWPTTATRCATWARASAT